MSYISTQTRQNHGILLDIFLFEPFLSVHQVGRVDSTKLLAIRLTGDNISEEHCYFEKSDGRVTLHGLPGGVTVRTLISATTRKVR